MRERDPWYRSKRIWFRRILMADLERAIRRCFLERTSRTDMLVNAIAERVMDLLERKE